MLRRQPGERRRVSLQDDVAATQQPGIKGGPVTMSELSALSRQRHGEDQEAPGFAVRIQIEQAVYATFERLLHDQV
jgi:hypothetical protein